MPTLNTCFILFIPEKNAVVNENNFKKFLLFKKYLYLKRRCIFFFRKCFLFSYILYFFYIKTENFHFKHYIELLKRTQFAEKFENNYLFCF